MNKATESLYQFTKVDKVIFLIFTIAFPLFMTITDHDPFVLEEFAGLLLITVDSVLLVYVFVFFLLKKFVSHKKPRLLMLQTGISFVVIILFEFSVYYLFHSTSEEVESLSTFLFLESFIIHLLLAGILLGLILLKKNIASQILLLKADNLQKSNELRVLKTQVDPHFLFNNLNTLDALIDTDVDKAKAYIQRLAKLYQYILASKDEDTVTLEEELLFAKNYSYLISERFGNSYNFNFTYENKDICNKLTPPGVIQIVFENIVKHNNASFKNPINITLLIRKDEIEVSNNIRSKSTLTESFGIGLTSLRARYHLLSDKNIEVKMDEHYTITLPLIDKLKS